MKQNSSILFHCMGKALIKTYLRRGLLVATAAVIAASSLRAAEKPEYLASFDPAMGFKPAQSDLTEVFLQIAGSLECYGSAVPYFAHMKAEHARIEAKYRQHFGTEPKHFCPAYMDDNYFEGLADNWKLLAPKLGLEPLTKKTGHLMRDAINGTRGTGTMLVEIFNQHQARVYASMIGKGTEPADFDALKTDLINRLEIGKRIVHDENYGMAQRDAVDFTTGIEGGFNRLFAALDTGLTPSNAARVKGFVTSICIDVGRMAQSELQAGIIENALDRQAATQANGR